MSARRALMTALAVVGPLVLLAACDRPEAEPAPLSAMPAVPTHVMGPQPGPDRPLPEVRNPFGDDPNAPVEGRRLFTWYNCAGCHGGHAGGGMGPSLRDVEWLYGHRDQDIFSSISRGRRHGMPAWGTKLPETQIWKLVAYIRCLDYACEPMPPPQNRSYPDAPPRRDVAGARGGGDG